MYVLSTCIHDTNTKVYDNVITYFYAYINLMSNNSVRGTS